MTKAGVGGAPAAESSRGLGEVTMLPSAMARAGQKRVGGASVGLGPRGG